MFIHTPLISAPVNSAMRCWYLSSCFQFFGYIYMYMCVYISWSRIAKSHGHVWVGKICWRRDILPIPVFLGFPCGSAGKESTCNAGDLGLIPRLGRCPGEGNSYPLQYLGLENSMDCIVHRVAKSRTQLSYFHFHSTVTGSLHV